MQKKNAVLLIALWATLVLAGLFSRSFFPIDETRYATVAWNMWNNGDYLVPYLNGVAYSHKPPLLFWLMNLGWKIFGLNDWWTRLIPSLFALASVFITRRIALLLWPDKPAIRDNASFILMSCGLWVVYSTTLMFDMLIAFFSVLGVWGLLLALKHDRKGWLLLALAIGGGLLAKGPTILLQILPVALLAPYWHNNATPKCTAKNWYLPILYATLAGIVIALCWAIPAGNHGGAQYQHEIFWGQTADRMVNSFAHKRPFWWYLAIAPLLLFPWLLWGAFWRGIFASKAIKQEFGTRFCLAWLLPVFIAFSFISGKQVHYVLPLFPACALLIARLTHDIHIARKIDLLPIALTFIILGIALVYLPHYAASHGVSVKNWVHLPAWLGYSVMGLGILLLALPQTALSNTTRLISISAIAMVALSMFVLVRTAGEAYDIRPVSRFVKALQEKQIPVVYVGKYAGTYDFVGRLTHAPDVVANTTLLPAWFEKHPDGQAIVFFDQQHQPKNAHFVQHYKGQYIALMTQTQWQAQHDGTQSNTETD